jgi:tRNA1(Val) A37 N6-methylase TrmN6
MTALPRNVVLVGDVRDRLRELPTASVDCIITSPPYFNARTAMTASSALSPRSTPGLPSCAPSVASWPGC